MKIEALAQLFPVKKGRSDQPETAIQFELAGQQFHIIKSALTSREVRLFEEVLFADKGIDFSELANGTYRLIQFRSEEFDEIADHLSLIFPSIVKVHKQGVAHGFAIEKLSSDRLSALDAKQALATLAQDLGVTCRYYLGLFADRTELESLYPIEKRNFDQGQTFSEAVIREGLTHLAHAPLAKIKQAILTDFEAQDLVRHLYQNDGNQLQTAKAMYIHRNTLTQKIKKFEKHYDLSLTGSDLVLLYSLIDQVTED
ncbi:MAG: helix-turn-helix domain-containing protein [Streptococcaceae bacterium]|jgi:DNA-binding protein Fis|nr:helix-turn-helix domain-containing protein [Streptococcaceae bacterium]